MFSFVRSCCTGKICVFFSENSILHCFSYIRLHSYCILQTRNLFNSFFHHIVETVAGLTLEVPNRFDQAVQMALF